jgi:ribosomal protein S18 acetylase RimI-like enzyme
MKVEFRNFQQQDFLEVEKMIFDLYEEDVYGETITSEKIHNTVQELTKHPEKGKIIVFICHREIVGYAIVIFFWSNEFGGNIIHIDELYVNAAWRNRGIATQFFKDLSSYGQENTKALQLEVTPTNRRAFTYYRRLGFAISKNTHLLKKI